MLSRCSLLAAVAQPPALEDRVTRAAGIAVPTNQGSSSFLLVAVAARPAQVDPVMWVLGTARPVEISPPLIHGVLWSFKTLRSPGSAPIGPVGMP